MEQIPEHPVIDNLLRTGWPDGREPEMPVCPICGKECDTFFLTEGQIIGCESCISVVDAYDYEE